MDGYLTIVKILFSQIWYWPALILLTLVFYRVPKFQNNTNTPKVFLKTNHWILLLGGFFTFIALSSAFWLLRDNAPHGLSDDTAATIQTYLSSSYRGDSINWTNSLCGGMDRWLLPNCHPLALGRLYALFLKQPYQLYLFIIGINVILVFVFSWKIQTEIWGMQRWSACIGALVAVLVEGYWTGKFPDAHVANGHGFAVIIVGIYCLTFFCDHRWFWLVAVLVGVALALGSWVPFHNLLPLLITITLWGLVFWGKGAWQKVVQANTLIILVFIIILFPNLLAIKSLFSSFARTEVMYRTADLGLFYELQPMIILVVMGVLGFALRIYNQKVVEKVIGLFLGFSLIPWVAHCIEVFRIMPSFRWELLYAGNGAWSWMAVVFFFEKIQQAIQERWPIGGIFCRLLIISVAAVVITFAWMTSVLLDLVSSYPSGNWKALTDTSVSSVLKGMEQKPGRVVGVGEDNDMHFWGQYQGLESLIGYTSFIDRKKTYFWWKDTMFVRPKQFYSSTYLSIQVPGIINSDALKLMNVNWVVSRQPLYHMEGLKAVIEQPGQLAVCHPARYYISDLNWKLLQQSLKDVSCLMQNYTYKRPLYVYHLEGSLPRVYLADSVFSWPTGQWELLNQQQLEKAVQRTAFVDLRKWKPFQGVSNSSAVTIDQYHSDYIKLQVKATKDSLVIYNSTLNGYWRLLIDGKEEEIFDVNGIQTGFWVNREVQVAELIYCPPWRFQRHPYCSKK